MKKRDKFKYICIIGDIRNSKKIKDREGAQKQFIRTLDAINLRFKRDIVSKFNITNGDEFQGLIYGKINFLDIITFIKIEMPNIDFRYGIGIGDLNTKIDKNEVTKMDGPVFYAAREAIEKVKFYEDTKKNAKTDIYVIKYGDEAFADDINLVLKNMKYHYDKMTNRQKNLINDIILNKEYNLSIYAKKQKETEQAISKVLLKANIYLYRENYDYVYKRMEEIL